MFKSSLRESGNAIGRRLLLVVLSALLVIATLVIIPGNAYGDEETTSTTTSEVPASDSTVSDTTVPTTTVPDTTIPETSTTTVAPSTTTTVASTTTVAPTTTVASTTTVAPTTTTTTEPVATLASVTDLGDDPAIDFSARGDASLFADPIGNPPLPANACGLNVALVMDSSGSIDDGDDGAANVQAVYDAYKAVLDGLAGTGSWATVVDYNGKQFPSSPNIPVITPFDWKLIPANGSASFDYE